MLTFLRKKPLVSICVPAYKSQDFIQDTIQSALDQTVDDVEIIISNDGGHITPNIERFRKNRNIKIFNLSKRNGWVANSNFVLSQARGEYFMILPHDDLLRPQYLEACLDVLRKDQDVFAAYSDIEHKRGIVRVSEARGPIKRRIMHIIRNLCKGYSYRALMRRRPNDWQRLRLQPNPPNDLFVDTTWILQQACFGELRRVPQPLYWKHMGKQTTHAAWKRLPVQQLADAWHQHCLQMGKIAELHIKDTDLVAKLVVHRFNARRVKDAPPFLKKVYRQITI